MLRGSYTATDDESRAHWQSTELSALVKSLPETIHKQYTYEEPVVRSCKHLSHSPFFKVRFLILGHGIYFNIGHVCSVVLHPGILIQSLHRIKKVFYH